MSGFFDLSTFGEPEQARLNLIITLVLGLAIIGLLIVGKTEVAVTVALALAALWRRSGRGVPLEQPTAGASVGPSTPRTGPRQPAAPDEGPPPLPRRVPQIISWLQPAAALLLVLGLAGCTVLTQPRKVTGQGLKSDAALVSELRASAKAEELRLAAAAGTKEEARARVLAYRGGIDLAEKLLERSRQNLRDVAKALGLDAPPVPAAPSPAPLPGGAP